MAKNNFLLKLQYFIENLRLKSTLYYILITVATFLIAKVLFSVKITIYLALETMIVMALYSFYTFTINNYFDRFNDNLNPIKSYLNPIASGKLSPRKGLCFSLFLFSLGTILTFVWFNYLVFLYLILLLNSTLYSIIFKSTPIINLMSHSIGVLGLFIFPAIVINLNYVWVVTICIVLILFSNLLQIENQILDFKYDKKARLNTLPIVYGIKFTKFLYYLSAILLIIVSVILFFSQSNFYALFLVLLGLLYLLKFTIKFISKQWDKILISLCLLFFIGSILFGNIL